MIDTDKYEGLIDAEGYIDYDGLDHLLAKAERLASRLRDAEDLLENCGYCRECFWDRESISDIAENILRYFRLGELTQKVWPKDCNPLCESCMTDFKEMIE